MFNTSNKATLEEAIKFRDKRHEDICDYYAEKENKRGVYMNTNLELVNVSKFELDNCKVEIKITEKQNNEVERLKEALKGANDEIKDSEEMMRKMQARIDKQGIDISEYKHIQRTASDRFVRTQILLEDQNKEIQKLKGFLDNNEQIRVLQVKQIAEIERENKLLKSDYVKGLEINNRRLLKQLSNEKPAILDMAKEIKEYCNSMDKCDNCEFVQNENRNRNKWTCKLREPYIFNIA